MKTMPERVFIALARGSRLAIVDAEDADLGDLRWHCHQNPGQAQYARRYTSNGARMHRIILGRKLGRELLKGEFVDHINGDGLDNRRANLRLATKSQNAANRKISVSNTSGVKGVSLCRRSGLWEVRCCRKFVGRFATKEEAAKSYDEAALRSFGEFARTNKAIRSGRPS